jgi:hypothetical protein
MVPQKPKNIKSVNDVTTISFRNEETPRPKYIDLTKDLYNGNLKRFNSIFTIENYNPDIHNWNFCARSGNITLAIFLKNKTKNRPTTRDVNTAAKNSQFRMLSFLMNTMEVPPILETLNIACYNGDMECITLLIDKGVPPSSETLDWAAEAGHTCVVIYLAYTFNLRISNKGYLMSVIYSHFNTVEFLTGRYKIPYPLHMQALKAAKELKNDKMLDYLLIN